MGIPFANHRHYDVSGRISQPDYIPTILDCLLVDSEHASDSDELTVVYDGVEYKYCTCLFFSESSS